MTAIINCACPSTANVQRTAATIDRSTDTWYQHAVAACRDLVPPPPILGIRGTQKLFVVQINSHVIRSRPRPRPRGQSRDRLVGTQPIWPAAWWYKVLLYGGTVRWY
eukprot:3378513-Rhodomonas_salina.1